MNAGIITIGDELIQGFTSDTNSKWLSNELSKYNIITRSIITIGDDNQSIIASLDTFLYNFNLNYIFITGGLGPTHDDITKKVLSEYFNKKLYVNEKYLEKLKIKFNADSYINKNKSIEKQLESQATIIEDAIPIMNTHGTALGMLIKYKENKIFVLPGVPEEMKNMYKNEIVLKYLSSKIDHFISYVTISTTGIYESKLYEILHDLITLNQSKIKLAFLPKFTGVDLRMSKISLEVDDQILNNFKIEIQNRIKKYIYSDSGKSLEQVVVNEFIKKKYTLSIAESCTGGLILKKITDIPGASSFLKGGIVAYKNKIKIELLRVSKKNIDNYGAVSEEVAIEMAKGIRKKMNSDMSIATTGISGPTGATDKKPLGLIYIALSTKDKTIVKKFNLIPKRAIHKEVSAYVALNMLRLFILKLK